MKQFIKNITIVILLVFVGDRVGGYVMHIFYSHSDSTVELKMNEVIYESNDSIILFGSSHCHHHYVTKVIEDSLHTTAYNAGCRGGCDIYFNYALFDMILQRHKPKCIIYDFISADYLPGDYDKMTNLSPFYGMAKEADSLFDISGLGMKYKLSLLYRYNGKVATSVMGCFIKPDTTIFKGYQPRHFRFNKIPVHEWEYPDTIDANKIRVIHRLIERCREMGIELYFTASPIYHKTTSSAYSPITEIANKEGIPFFNHVADTLFVGHNEYFSDESHLNNDGAVLFTNIIAKELINTIDHNTETKVDIND